MPVVAALVVVVVVMVAALVVVVVVVAALVVVAIATVAALVVFTGLAVVGAPAAARAALAPTATVVVGAAGASVVVGETGASVVARGGSAPHSTGKVSGHVSPSTGWKHVAVRESSV